MKKFNNFEEMAIHDQATIEALNQMPKATREMFKQQVAVEKEVINNPDMHTTSEIAKSHATLIDIAERIEILTDSYISSKELQAKLQSSYFYK